MSRLPETEQSLLRHLRAEKRQRLRNEGASPYSRSGLSVTAEGSIVASGQIQSDDYDGTSPTALGTKGWALAKRADLLSRIVLNGVDLQADLDAKDVAILGLIDDLSAAQSALAAQQAALTTEIARINTLVGQQIETATNTGSQTNFSITSGVGGYATVSVTVPAGYTQASIQANAVASLYYTGATNPETVWSRVRIDGSDGPELSYLVDTSTVGSRITSAQGTHSHTLTGLSGGASISASMRLRSNVATWPSNTYNTAAVSMLAVFRR
jgi:hypothetical protein